MYLAAIVVIHVDDATWYLSWRSVTMAWMNGSAKPARVSMMRATTSGSNSSRPYPTTSLPMASAPTAVSRLLKSEIPPVPCRAATSQMLAARAEVMPYFRARSRAAIALATSKRTSDEWNLVVSPRSWSSTPTYSTSSSRSMFSVSTISWASSTLRWQWSIRNCGDVSSRSFSAAWASLVCGISEPDDRTAVEPDRGTNRPREPRATSPPAIRAPCPSNSRRDSSSSPDSASRDDVPILLRPPRGWAPSPYSFGDPGLDGGEKDTDEVFLANGPPSCGDGGAGPSAPARRGHPGARVRLPRRRSLSAHAGGHPRAECPDLHRTPPGHPGRAAAAAGRRHDRDPGIRRRGAAPTRCLAPGPAGCRRPRRAAGVDLHRRFHPGVGRVTGRPSRNHPLGGVRGPGADVPGRGGRSRRAVHRRRGRADERGCGRRSRQHVPVVDVQHAGIDLHGREHPRQ